MKRQHDLAFELSSGTNTEGRRAVGWKCSTCGVPITSIEDGWVEWLAIEDPHGTTRLKGLRLVHRWRNRPGPPRVHGCRYDYRREFRADRSIVEGLSLERFVGPDGLILLLAFLAADELPKDDVLELAKRVQVPGYEQTRELFQAAIDSGVVTPVIRDRYYLQSEMRALLRWARDEVRSGEKSVP